MQKNNDIPIGARLSNLDKIFKESVRSYCNKHGLNFTYSKIIMMLHRHPEGVIQNDIVDNTYLKKSTISLTLKSMEQEGYITRVTCADDNLLSYNFQLHQSISLFCYQIFYLLR